MFLKALTIKGFKSFADSASLDMEPGITVVVGPNGSGKSNVVDAMAWVLGAQAPTAVRSQKMDDVIFAGTSNRKPLGRAEVSLTIDNEDNQIPIEFSEVTFTRTLFRSGDSDYAINGVSCRLLDIQELLSDSGVGRQQHIIVSQGRIDDVLNARPEERRGIIEEAAGVLKYRKRKERAERRLAATEENLNRLKDLLREVRRQVRPLEKQAEAARRHETLAEELLNLKIHLSGRQLRSLTSRLEGSQRGRRESNQREHELTSTLASLDATVLDSEAHLASLGASDIADVSGRARSLRERIRGQRNVIAERRRRLEGELQSAVDEGLVANLEAESAKLEGELRAATHESRALRPEFAHQEEVEARLSSEQLSFDTEWGDELAPKPTKAPEMRAQIEAMEQADRRSRADMGRLDSDLQAVAARVARVTEEQRLATETLERLQIENPRLEHGLDASTAQASRAEADLEERTEQRRQADDESSRWQARRDALAQALDDARSRAGADALDGIDGVVGALLDLVAIDEGWELAVEAAAGEALQAVVVDSPDGAVGALATLEAKDLAGAVLALGRPRQAATAGLITGPLHQPVVGRPLRDRVRARRADVDPLLDALFGSAIVVDGGWRVAIGVAIDHPDATVVTRAGDRFGPGGWRIGLTGAGATGAALDEAEAAAASAAAAATAASERFEQANQATRTATKATREAEEAMRTATVDLDRASRSRDRASEQLEQFTEDRDRLHEQRRQAAHQQGADRAVAEQLKQKLPAVENEEAEYLNRVEALSLSRTSLEERARAAAQSRKDLEVRAAAIEQRREILVNRQTETESRLERLVVERDKARVRREAIEGAMAAVDGLTTKLDASAGLLDHWIELLGAEQQVQSEAARRVSAELTARRNERQAAERELVEVRERRSRIELEETENRVKLEALTEALRRELDTEPDVAMATEQPEIEANVSPEARVRDLERELKLLGPINPLALEEFEALKERHEFLDGQMNDVKKARKDLNTLIHSIDEEIVVVFSAAYADVSTNFVDLFATLFPGGTGGVKLVNPDDVLNCGIEIEAKPSGKNVKKLSLLSGGERSLVALAFLFAVFRSRPSPFYVMDEVEAALDDVNLSRFLSLVEEFRKEAQLIIVSHQKRTMEAADVLYGVTMKPGGSSKVVSQKVEGRRSSEPVLDLTDGTTATAS
ncbi:MAG: chromosome segregation protein SMC [Actinomycetia bacterium]|nr:chromosome segregation protein SMC [Actinomycetes bacterium]MCP5031985.1 chromosome segregation protein SMC [Actinomycetes bacterium]